MIAWLLAAGAHEPEPTSQPGVPDQPIVVIITTDTLGMAAARETDWCGHLGSVLGAHGRDVACVEGGVSPSSWTAEAHTRLLWPSHLVGAKRAEIEPLCREPSVHGVLAASLGATTVWGADNPLLADDTIRCRGRSPWFQDADHAFGWETAYPVTGEVPEEERPVGEAIGALLDASARGGPVVGFLNALEVGGHFPRCYFDPNTPACDGMWRIAVDGGLPQPDADRALTWKNRTFIHQFLTYTSNTLIHDQDRLRPLFWTSMLEAIAHAQGSRFDDRLDRLLTGLDAQGRTDDLVLLVVSDHGETPCAHRPVGDQHLTCTHGGLPNEFSANVPVFISPASLADRWRDEGFVGDAATPWTTAALSWALLDAFGVPPPAEWPADGPEPVGTATVLTCDRPPDDKNHGPLGTGVHIVGDASVRCQGDDCVGMRWQIPDGPLYHADVLDPIPPELADYDGDWAVQACAR